MWLGYMASHKYFNYTGLINTPLCEVKTFWMKRRLVWLLIALYCCIPHGDVTSHFNNDKPAKYITTAVSMPREKHTDRKTLLWHKANYNTICNYIDELTQNFFNTYDHHISVDILWQEFKTMSKTWLNMIPQAKAPSGSRPPWLSKNIKRLTRIKQRKYNKARHTNSPENWAAYYDLKKQVQKLCRASHNNYATGFQQ